ncbi:GNAT family N-acetyltransferase [Paenibacillus sp. YPG26]|uniref:GNAT family N-acetyltransferase n=1 Tax=Paenibacillus sp. YPG26 TaxID=2878915 RepID=UPI00203FD6CC|nr:GNAT family N-acetyltransferase [Paenibacillus sp. YPG26]USB33384.1 GNAT family N-acetyltransferase [Paenibacillus sp. YPG26]
MNIKFYDNLLSADDYLFIHQAMNYDLEPREQIEQALSRSIRTVTAKDGDKIVGMGRLVGDGLMYCYIQDVRVLPYYQNKGIGKAIINRMIEYARQNGLPNTVITIGLSSAKGAERFYENLGFIKQPCHDMGHGMYIDMEID